MQRQHKLITILVCLLVLSGFLTNAKAQSAEQKPTRHLVSIYQAAPGKHLQLLEWFAQQEFVVKEAGAPATQWFVHLDGASWDYIGITKLVEPAKQEKLDKKIDELAKNKGMATGMAASLEFRQFISSHTDTYVMGPFTAKELVQEAEKRD